MKRKEWKKQLLAGITAIGMIFGMVLGIGNYGSSDHNFGGWGAAHCPV